MFRMIDNIKKTRSSQVRCESLELNDTNFYIQFSSPSSGQSFLISLLETFHIKYMLT